MTLTAEATAKILIVDDHQMFREGIRRRLEDEGGIEIVGEASSGQEALDKVESLNPSIVLMDIRMPEMSGIEAARIMRRRWPDLKIMLLTGYDFDQYVRAAARAGIQGYLLKDSPQETLVDAIRDVIGGGTVLSPHIASKVIQSFAESPSANRERQPSELTLREIEILEMLYQGMRNADIAGKLSISPRTVEAHVGNIISKLDAQSRTEAVRIAVSKNLIK